MYDFEIRPHHGLCTGFFEGKGYSAEFVKHMAEMIAYLDEHNPEVKLVLHTDRICSACPHNVKGICESADKVLVYDQKILSLCDLHENQILEWEKFQEIVNLHILKSDKLTEVCRGCQWLYLCSNNSSGREMIF